MYRAIFAILLIAWVSGCGVKTPESHGKEDTGLMIDNAAPATVKETAVAGAFYPDDPDETGKMIARFMEEAAVEPKAPGEIFAIFVPHAGYIYSGACAAYAFKAASRQTPETIILLSPSHYEYFDGVAYPDYDEFATPSGNIEVDKPCVETITSKGNICEENNTPFAKEHGIEVQLPFIKRIWPEAKVAPFIFGNPSQETADKFAECLAKYADDRNDVLIVATCDLSHYHPYEEAVKLDAVFFDAFTSGNPGSIFDAVDSGKCEIDAPGVVYATLSAGNELGFVDTIILDERNSGDVTGDKERVVGYWAAILVKR